MTAREQGFLLLTGYLGDLERKPLTIAQFRDLTLRARGMDRPMQERELTQEDLLGLGCDRTSARRILHLLSQTEQLQWYLEKGRRQCCFPITRVSPGYPDRLRSCLGLDAPGVLWAKGDADILKLPAVTLVGSRELNGENREFAREAGKQAALQGFALVSGNARGADRIAQDSCLAHGGRVISVVADALADHPAQPNVIFISEDGFDLTFSAQRALQRNRTIHSLGQKTFVAQSRLGKGGTWDGTSRNLKLGFSPVFCFRDGSEASLELDRMGAALIGIDDLGDFASLQVNFMSFIDQ